MNCCICGSKIVKGHGNNPWPVKDSGECCDICNMTVVLQERIKRLQERVKRLKERKE